VSETSSSANLRPAATLVRRGVERRPVVLAATAVLFAAVFALHRANPDPAASLGLLYVIPVTLAALELGLTAGLVGAAVSTGLLLTSSPTQPGALEVLTRAVVYAAAGGIAGRFSDRMRQAQRRQERLLDSGLALSRLEESDDLAATLARHAALATGATGVRVTLGSGVPAEIGRVGSSPEVIELYGGDAPGRMEVDLPRTGGSAGEERAALALLALQAGVARENRRLLDSERKRAALQAELREARGRLAERARQLGAVLDMQERERRDLARELHEEAAQTLAAVLLELDMLERDVETGDHRVAELRDHVGAAIGSLRDLAVALRPPVLDGIGLVPALERLGEGRIPGVERVSVQLDPARRLAPEAETAVYRVVEDALRAVEGRRVARVGAETAGGEVMVTVRPLNGGRVIRDLTTLAARLDLLGGTIDSQTDELVVRLPVDSGGGPTSRIIAAP
jgi:signal transduction histidine kinase